MTDLFLTLPRIDERLFVELFRQVIGSPPPARWRTGGSDWVRYLLHTDFHAPLRFNLDRSRGGRLPARAVRGATGAGIRGRFAGAEGPARPRRGAPGRRGPDRRHRGGACRPRFPGRPSIVDCCWLGRPEPARRRWHGPSHAPATSSSSTRAPRSGNRPAVSTSTCGRSASRSRRRGATPRRSCSSTRSTASAIASSSPDRTRSTRRTSSTRSSSRSRAWTRRSP